MVVVVVGGHSVTGSGQRQFVVIMTPVFKSSFISFIEFIHMN